MCCFKILMCLLFLGFSHCFAQEILKAPAERSEFIYDNDEIPSCHASTLIELPNGEILAAWFGGKNEGDPSVEIWLARRSGYGWSKPKAMTQDPSIPTWNPVLYRGDDGKLWLFFKIGPSPREWSGAYRISADDGKTWSEMELMPAGLLGPIKNKPIQLANGDLLCGSSVESYRTWTCWVEILSHADNTWSKHGPIAVPQQLYGVIQPTVWEYAPGKLKMLMRSRNIGFVVESHSQDGGKTWSPGQIVPALPHPGSGIDAVQLQDGVIALVYNHTSKGRTPLNIALSYDNGINWSKPWILEDMPGEYSYPAIIAGRDGKLHITYTWNRKRIKYVVVDPGILR